VVIREIVEFGGPHARAGLERQERSGAEPQATSAMRLAASRAARSSGANRAAKRNNDAIRQFQLLGMCNVFGRISIWSPS
jgi:hypothetical protein